MMSGTANNLTCETSFNSEQLTHLIGASNILLFDVVQEKLQEKKVEIQKRNSKIYYLNSKIRRITVEKEELLATLTSINEACRTFGVENVTLQSEVNIVKSRVNILTSEKEILSQSLSKSEIAHQESLTEKTTLEDANSALHSQVANLIGEKEELARLLAESVKLCEELRKKNDELNVTVEEYTEDNLYWQSENRELTISSTICDLCLQNG